MTDTTFQFTTLFIYLNKKYPTYIASFVAEIVVYLTDRCSSQDKSKFQNAEFSMQVETTKKTKLTKKTPDI